MYPACVENSYSLTYVVYWDVVFDALVTEYPDVAMDAYLLNVHC